MTLVDVTLALPQELVEQAKAVGVLTEERVAALLEAEVKRIIEWQTFQQTLNQLRSAAEDEFGEMTEDQIMQIVNEEVKAVRAERRKRQQGQAAE